MKFISLISWTDQGVKAAKESPQRLDKARDLAHGFGIKIEQAFLTLGDMDMVCIVEAPSDEAYAKFQLKLAAGGSVRTRSIKAFAEADYRGIMAAL